jgi:hypothetical protein
MTFDPEVLCGKGSHVDDAKEVGLSWFHRYLQVLGVIHQCCLRDRFCSGGIGNTKELLDETRHLVVVPIRKCEYQLSVNLIGIRILGIVYDERAAKTIWVLAIDMGVIPVRAWLIDLEGVSQDDAMNIRVTYCEIIGK